MQFPAEMLIEYVRVYQRKGETNIGCDPPNYPTANYIQSHLDTYSSKCLSSSLCSPTRMLTCLPAPDPNLTAFNYQVPTNGLVSALTLIVRSNQADDLFYFLQYEGGC